MQPRQASDSLVARSAPRARSWRSAPGRALGGVLLLVLSVLADSRARRAPSFVPAAPLGGLGGARAPRSLSRGRRGRAVLALRGSSASETAEMLRVPWRAGTGAADAADAADAAAGTREDGAGGQRLGGSASETRTMLRVPWGGDRRPRAAARVEGGVDPAIVLRVPWRPPATGGGGEGGAGGAGGAGVEDGAAGGAAAVQSGGDAALAEEEARPREPNKLQQLLAECIRVLPGGGERDQGEIPESLLELLAQLSADDLGAASLTAHVPDMAQGGAAPVCYADLYDSDAFSVTLFSLPPASTLPLHSHPNMTVISRVLLGSVNVTSFATAPAPDKGGGGGMFGMFGGLGGGDRVLGQLDLVPRIVGRNLSSSCEEASVMHPADSAFMQYSTQEGCVILDILTPPYDVHSWQDKRECRYYSMDRGKGDTWTAKPLKFSKTTRLNTKEIAYVGLPVLGHPSVPPTGKFSRFGGR